MSPFKNFSLSREVLLAGALAISACGREAPPAPPVAAVQADTTGDIKKVLEDPAKVPVNKETVPDRPLPAPESVDHREERDEAERIRLEALQANAPAYEAGFDKAAKIFKEALKRGQADLDRFVARKASEFELEIERKGLKGEKEGEEGFAIDRMDERAALLSEFVKNVENPTFIYSLGGTTVTVQFYGRKEWQGDWSIWQDYLWKSIAGGIIANSDFDVGFSPEGESDAIPGPRISVTIKGKGIYQFEAMSEQGNHGGIDELSIAFGAKGNEPQAMEELTTRWNQASDYGSEGAVLPAGNSEEYHCYYNPSADSVVHFPGWSGAEANIPERIDRNKLWPIWLSFSRD